MSKKLIQFLKGWGSLIVIDPSMGPVRDRIEELRKRNPREIDYNNIKKDFQIHPPKSGKEHQ